jgi:hypothetical protein
VRTIVIFFAVIWLNTASAQVVQLHVSGIDGKRYNGTAVCVGMESQTSHVFATAKHNLRDMKTAVVKMSDGTDYPIHRLAEHPSGDVATFVCNANALPLPICDCAHLNADVEVVGWGPFFHQRAERLVVRSGKIAAKYKTSFVVRNQRAQVVTGDSGGAVVTADRRLCGLISGFESENPLNTVVAPGSAIAETVAITHTLQCPGGNCPIVIRRQIQQPMIGIGVPVGPPRSVPIAVPAPQPERVYVPQPQPDPMFTPVAPTDAQIAAAVSAWFGVHGSQLRGPSGPAGPSGQQGAPGERGSGVTKEQVESTVNAWLDANLDRIRGPSGPSGERGPHGLVGVPDDQDIRNWLVGAMSDPATRQQLSGLLADLVATDPRVDALIQRLEALENRPVTSGSGDVGAIDKRLKVLESNPPKVTIVVTDDGKEVFNRSGVPGGSTVKVPITRVER